MASCYKVNCKNVGKNRCDHCHKRFCNEHWHEREILCEDCYNRPEPNKQEEEEEAHLRRLDKDKDKKA